MHITTKYELEQIVYYVANHVLNNDKWHTSHGKIIDVQATRHVKTKFNSTYYLVKTDHGVCLVDEHDLFPNEQDTVNYISSRREQCV